MLLRGLRWYVAGLAILGQSPRASAWPGSGHAAPLPAARPPQIVLVESQSWDAARATLRRYSRAGNRYLPEGNKIPVVLGKRGMAWGNGVRRGPSGRDPKQEGDMRSPAGVFPLSRAFGYAPVPPKGTRLPYSQSLPSTVCVDDPASRHYNTIRHSPRSGLSWRSAEQMARPDDLYRWVVFVDHNVGPRVTPGLGSCIFLHVWRGPAHYTAGCTAMSERDLAGLVAWLAPGAVLVQAPMRELPGLCQSSGLRLEGR